MLENYGLPNVGNAKNVISLKNPNYQANMDLARDVIDNGSMEFKDQLIKLGAGNLAGTQFGEPLDDMPLADQDMLDAYAIDDLELTMGEPADARLWMALGEVEVDEEEEL